MNIHICDVTCDICGGDGVGTIQTAGAAWRRGTRLAHTDPAVCRSNLERQRRALERERLALQQNQLAQEGKHD